MFNIEKIETLKILKDIVATELISSDTRENAEIEINSIINKIREDGRPTTINRVLNRDGDAK